MSSKTVTIDGNDSSDDDIKIIDKIDVKPEVIEVLESPDIVVKRNRLLSQSMDSPIHCPKNRNKRLFSDSDDEEIQCIKQTKTEDSEDRVGRKAFEEMCENTIKELSSLFPEIDVCEIQDALIETNWSVFNASIKLGNLFDGTTADDAVDADVKPSVKEEPKICTNNEKMKNLDYYRKWRPNGGSVSEVPEELIPTSSHNFNSIKNNKNKFSKQSKRLAEELDESSDDDNNVEEYTKNDFKINCDNSSDDDNSDDNQVLKDKSTSKGFFLKTTELKQKVVEFLQNSNSFEMLIIPGVSAKKIDLIISLRPFSDWIDLYSKFSANNLSTDILDKCFEVLRARDVVQRLMSSCEEIANELNKTVDQLKALAQPKLLNPEMKLSHYQMIGLNWLALMYKKDINCILADEMGLGKTIQVIAFFAYLIETKSIRGPHLVIVPSSTLDNWSREFQNWCPDINLLLYYGSQDDRALIREQMSRNMIDFDVILTTYTVAQSPGDRSLFKKNKFRYVVFDEAHYLKNMKSTRYSALMALNAKRRLLLTGTPLQNNLVELMSLLIFTMPHMFSGKTDQIKTLFTYNNKDSIHRISYINERILQAKKIMKPFVLRRLKEDVLKELPLKREEVVHCSMTEDQELQYMELIENYTREIKYKKITFEDSETEEKFKRGNGMLMNLRKVANHPLLLRKQYDNKKLRQMSKLMIKEETYRNADPQLIYEDMELMHDFELHCLCKRYRNLNSFQLTDDLVLDSGKFRHLDELLTTFRNEGKRVLLFSQFTLVLDIIEEYMRLRFYEYLRLDGSTKVGDRLDLIDKYNNDPNLFVFLLSTRAGGLGINLTAASVVIIHDIDFNPYNDKQAEDRCHRIGQTQEVVVYRLISKNSIEEGMLRIAEEKLRLGRDISAPHIKANDDKEEDLDKSDVKTLLRAALKL